MALEYVFVHRGGNGLRYVYELVFDGDMTSAAAHLPGLIEVAGLTDAATTSNLGAATPDLVASSGPARGQLGATSCPSQTREKPSAGKTLPGLNRTGPENAYQGRQQNAASYRSGSSSATEA